MVQNYRQLYSGADYVPMEDEIDYTDDYDFGGTQVVPGELAYTGQGNSYYWDKPLSCVIENDGLWQLWRAISDFDNANIYLIVDINSSNVDDDPFQDEEEARTYFDNNYNFGHVVSQECDPLDAEMAEDCENIRDRYGDKIYTLFLEYIGDDQTKLARTLYSEAGWCDFNLWLKTEKGIDLGICGQVVTEDANDDYLTDDDFDDIKSSDNNDDIYMIADDVDDEYVPVSELNADDSYEDDDSDITVIAVEEPVKDNDKCELDIEINNVMNAYQTANKWLDSVKEAVYSKPEMSCPFFSSYIHTLAHKMPGRFDKFGDILHTINYEIPYPATSEIGEWMPDSISKAFDTIFKVLDDIKSALNIFIKAADENYHGMACAAEALLNDIEEEYPMLYRLKDKWNQCDGDTVTFDKFVCQYVDHKDDLLEQLEINEDCVNNKIDNSSWHLDESLNEDKSDDVEQQIRSIEATIVYKGKVDNFDNIKNDVEEAIYSKYSNNENINLGNINVEVVQGNDFTYYDEQADEQVVALFISSDDTTYKDILEAEDEVTDEKYIEKVDVEDDFTELLKSLQNVIDGEVIYVNMDSLRDALMKM